MSSTAKFLAPTDPTALHVHLIVTDSFGLQSSEPATAVVYIGIKPIFGLQAANDSPTVLGQPTTLSTSVAVGTKVVYHWNFGDGSAPVETAASQIGHVYPGVGLYTATVQATNELSPTETTTTRLQIINSGPYTPSQPSPADVSANVATDVTLTWHGGDPNGQSVTYTVSFGALDPPPVVATGVTRTQYAPGALALQTTYFWRITATDGLSWTGGPVWSFSTSPRPRYVYLPVVLRSEP